MTEPDPQQIAPSYDEIQSKADYHLQEAARAISAQWPWWAGKQRPDWVQRRAMRRVARRIGRDRAILDAARDRRPVDQDDRADPADRRLPIPVSTRDHTHDQRRAHVKITDLITELENLKTEHGDLDVTVAQDAEGNGFGALAEATWQYYLGSEDEMVSPCNDECGDCEDCAGLEDAARVAMLWPV